MTNRASKLLLALMVAAGAAFGQSTPPAPRSQAGRAPASPAAGTETTDASSIVLAQRPRDSRRPAGRTRTASPGPCRPALRPRWPRASPKYGPPTPTPTPAAEPHGPAGHRQAEERDQAPAQVRRARVAAADLPRAGPQHDGRADRPLVQEPPGLIFGNLLGLNSGVAYQMYLDDQRLENIADMTDIAHAMSRGGDAAAVPYILSRPRARTCAPMTP